MAFKKGQSGNPGGRPKGARHKYLRAMEALLEGEAEGLTRRVIQLALEGDTTALRLCLERLLPPRKERPVMVDLPRVKIIADAPIFLSKIVELTALGELTPGEAQALSSLMEPMRKATELVELEERVAALEGTQKRRSSEAR